MLAQTLGLCKGSHLDVDSLPAGSQYLTTTYLLNRQKTAFGLRLPQCWIAPTFAVFFTMKQIKPRRSKSLLEQSNEPFAKYLSHYWLFVRSKNEITF